MIHRDASVLKDRTTNACCIDDDDDDDNDDDADAV